MFDALPPSLTLLFNALQHLVLQYLAIPVDTLCYALRYIPRTCDT